MESDEYTSEENKRRRNSRDTEDVFRRSKKIMRSPRENKGEEKNWETLMNMIKEIMKDTKEIKLEQKNFQEEIVRMKQENNKIKEENREMKKEMKEMRDRLERMEREKIKNNIIVSGLEINAINGKELKEEIEKGITEKIGVHVKIADAMRIGPKMYKAELMSFAEKQEIMKNKQKLKEQRERIYIDNELSKGELEIQRKIIQWAKEERKKGKIVKIGYKKATIEGKEWRWEMEKEQMKEVKMNKDKNMPKN